MILVLKRRTALILHMIQGRGTREGGLMEVAPPEAVVRDIPPDPVSFPVAGQRPMENGQTNSPFLGTECDGSLFVLIQMAFQSVFRHPAILPKLFPIEIGSDSCNLSFGKPMQPLGGRVSLIPWPLVWGRDPESQVHPHIACFQFCSLSRQRGVTERHFGVLVDT